jgi:alkyl hydroperoxide reductase subunit AhpC
MIRNNVLQIADEDRKISTLYDMLDAQDATNRDAKGLPFTVRFFNYRRPWILNISQIRTVFVIDPKKVIRLTISYPASTGRNFDEIIRYVHSLPFKCKALTMAAGSSIVRWTFTSKSETNYMLC